MAKKKKKKSKKRTRLCLGTRRLGRSVDSNLIGHKAYYESDWWKASNDKLDSAWSLTEERIDFGLHDYDDKSWGWKNPPTDKNIYQWFEWYSYNHNGTLQWRTPAQLAGERKRKETLEKKRKARIRLNKGKKNDRWSKLRIFIA